LQRRSDEWQTWASDQVEQVRKECFAAIDAMEQRYRAAADELAQTRELLHMMRAATLARQKAGRELEALYRERAIEQGKALMERDPNELLH
jgi:hypothetical protein